MDATSRAAAKQVFSSTRDGIRSLVLGASRFPLIDRLRSLDPTGTGVVSLHQLAVVLHDQGGLPVTDEELEAINVRFGDRKGGVLYEKLWGHLGVTPPSDYVDPDAHFDRLPQPFRLVDELVRSIVDDAWEVLAARAAHPDVWQAKSQLATAPPSTFWSDLGTEAPTCVSTDAPGGRLFVGTSSGTIAVFAALRSDEPLGRISAFHTGGGGSKTDPGQEQEPTSSKEGDGEGGVDQGAVGGVTVMPAVAPAAPLPLRGANTDGVAPTNLLDPHSERGVALCVATCVPRPAPGGDVEPTDDVPAPPPAFGGLVHVYHVTFPRCGGMDTAEFRLVATIQTDSPVRSIDQSPDGRYATVLTADGALRVVHLEPVLFFPVRGRKTEEELEDDEEEGALKPYPLPVAVRACLTVPPVPDIKLPDATIKCLPSAHFALSKLHTPVAPPRSVSAAEKARAAGIAPGGKGSGGGGAGSVASGRASRQSRAGSRAASVAGSAVAVPAVAGGVLDDGPCVTGLMVWWTHQNRMQRFDLPTARVLGRMKEQDAEAAAKEDAWAAQAAAAAAAGSNGGGGGGKKGGKPAAKKGVKGKKGAAPPPAEEEAAPSGPVPPVPTGEWMVPAAVTAASLSASSALLVTGLEDGGLVVWATATGVVSCVLESHGGAVTAVATHGDRWVVSGAADGSVHIYDLTRAACTTALAAAAPADGDVPPEAPAHGLVAGALYWASIGADASTGIADVPYLHAARRDGLARVSRVAVLGELPLAIVAGEDVAQPRRRGRRSSSQPGDGDEAAAAPPVHFVNGVGMVPTSTVLYVYDLEAGQVVGRCGGSRDGAWVAAALAAVDPRDTSNTVWTSRGDVVATIQMTVGGGHPGAPRRCRVAAYYAWELAMALYPAIGRACGGGGGMGYGGGPVSHAAKQLFLTATPAQRCDPSAELNLNEMLAAANGQAARSIAAGLFGASVSRAPSSRSVVRGNRSVALRGGTPNAQVGGAGGGLDGFGAPGSEAGASSFGNALTRGGRGTTVAPGPAATPAGPTPFAVLGGMFDDVLAESKEKADASRDVDMSAGKGTAIFSAGTDAVQATQRYLAVARGTGGDRDARMARAERRQKELIQFLA